MTIHLDPSRPIYLQIMEEIKRRAVRGEYMPGSRLPSVRDLAGEMTVNPNTVARVYLELEREGFVETRRGQGTFLTSEKTLIEQARNTFAEDAVRRFVEAVDALNLDNGHRAGLIDLVREQLKHDNHT